MYIRMARRARVASCGPRQGLWAEGGGLPHTKPGWRKNVCREAGGALAAWEQTWASLILPPHCPHLPWDYRG